MALARSLAGSLLKPLAAAITGASGGADPYAANGFSPDYVADFSATDADYFRVAGVDSDFSTAFTADSGGNGPGTQVDSSGNLVWRAHNLLVYSRQFDNAAWTKTRCTIDPNQGTDAAGNTTADLVIPSVDNDSHYLLNGQTSVVGVSYTFAVVAERSGYDLQLWFGTGNAVGNPYANFDLAAGTVASNPAGGASITDLGGGKYLCQIEYVANITNVAVVIGVIDDTSAGRAGVFAGDGSSGVLISDAHGYRSDLGGMADNPDPVATGLEKYVPTTTAARFLARRRHHRWDGSAYVPTCLHEPVGARNYAISSRDFTAWNSSQSPALTKNSTGIDGVANSAYTVEDASGNFASIQDSESVTSDTAVRGVAVYIKKTSSASSFPGVAIVYGGSSVGAVTVDTDNGTLTDRTSLAPTASYIEDADTHWRVSVFFANSSQTTMEFYIYPAVNTDASGTWAAATTGSIEIDQADFYADAGVTLPSSPIITTSGSVTRTADTLKGKAASLPYSSTAISMAFAGRLTSEAGTSYRALDWYESGTARALLGANPTNRYLVASNSSTLTATAGAQGSGVLFPEKLAGRWVGGSATQCASAGTAGTEQSTALAIPDLSDDDLFVMANGDSVVLTNGTVDTIRLWSDDIAEDGLTEATS